MTMYKVYREPASAIRNVDRIVALSSPMLHHVHPSMVWKSTTITATAVGTVCTRPEEQVYKQSRLNVSASDITHP